ncbi:hypothetical protein B0J12DRAFT_317593 [Macrophomina phaseolina]|uniref:Uncharacterized protein n=1 Tax=Macrophomina phaseolina TaxID=35725 RepID=A0ABQ8FYZ9_9PEZI|nr:hypothetical protein B0J12DRAFT_317593 [Macrophomina phaseolina]
MRSLLLPYEVMGCMSLRTGEKLGLLPAGLSPLFLSALGRETEHTRAGVEPGERRGKWVGAVSMSVCSPFGGLFCRCVLCYPCWLDRLPGGPLQGSFSQRPALGWLAGSASASASPPPRLAFRLSRLRPSPGRFSLQSHRCVVHRLFPSVDQPLPESAPLHPSFPRLSQAAPLLHAWPISCAK